jgi:hypothetical protein
MNNSAQNAGFCDVRSLQQMAKGHWRSGALIQALSWSKTMNSSNSRRTVIMRMAAVAA